MASPSHFQRQFAMATQSIPRCIRASARKSTNVSWQSQRSLQTHTHSSRPSHHSSRSIAPFSRSMQSSTRPFRRSDVPQVLSNSRLFSTTPSRRHGDLTPPKPGEERKITFIDKEGQEHVFEVADGDNLLDIAQANDLEMEGACGGSCACSTCHVVVANDEMFDKMEEPSDDENDMLDLAFGLTETSRLGCQVVMSKELDGLVVKLPSMTRNLQSSDFEDKSKRG